MKHVRKTRHHGAGFRHLFKDLPDQVDTGLDIGATHGRSGKNVRVRGRGGREIELIVDEIGAVLAHVLDDATGAGIGAGHAEAFKQRRVDIAHALRAKAEHRVREHHAVNVGQIFLGGLQNLFHPGGKALGQMAAHAAGQDEHVIDPRAGQFLEPVEHQVAHIGHPLPDKPEAERSGDAAQKHHVAVEAAHLEDQRPHPGGHFRHLDARQFLDGRRIAIFVEIGLGHADAADDREDLNEGPPLHQLLKAAVQIADMGFPLDHLIAADGQLDRHVAGDAGVVRPLPEFEVFARLEVDLEPPIRAGLGVLAAVGLEAQHLSPRGKVWISCGRGGRGSHGRGARHRSAANRRGCRNRADRAADRSSLRG